MRRYGKQHKKPTRNRIFVELPSTPARPPIVEVDRNRQARQCQQPNPTDGGDDDGVSDLAERITAIDLQPQDDKENSPAPPKARTRTKAANRRKKQVPDSPPAPPAEPVADQVPEPEAVPPSESPPKTPRHRSKTPVRLATPDADPGLRVLSWSEVCPLGDKIAKIAEASYAEVYRVTNERGTSIIKVIRMESPIKPQTKAQEKSGLVDEEPHPESDLLGELKISELLADIPGFVIYKERYVVQGKACRELLDTHQAFHRKLKRKDPDRLQFYPSPSRYLDDTKFLVVELGDAGTALEDFELTSSHQLWDVFLHVAIALARAEVQVEFEHRDLHEGNLCIRATADPHPPEDRDSLSYFGRAGLEVTILDYGLSRASADADSDEAEPMAYDLERDLSIFTSEHAPQCRVYRQMRSFFLRGDRVCLPPEGHKTPYARGVDGRPISWAQHEPYTNVLWLAYIYDYMVGHFRGPKKELGAFRRVTREFWLYLDPEQADDAVPGFASASDIVRFAVESGWIDPEQLTGGRDEAGEKSILSILSGGDEHDLSRRLSELHVAEHDDDDDEDLAAGPRRSPRRPRRGANDNNKGY